MARLILNTENFQGEVAAMVERATNWRVPLKLFGLHMLRSVAQNFQEQGRPDRWPDLKLATILARKNRGNSQRKNKFRAVKDAKGRKGGAVSAVQSAGGTVHAAAAGRTFTSGAVKAIMGARILMDRGQLRQSISMDVNNMQVVVGTNLKYAATHQFGDEDRGIPDRPYLVAQQEDDLMFAEYLGRHLAGTL